jgi:O-antigen ligase
MATPVAASARLSRLAVPVFSPLRLLHLLIMAPSWLFVATLALMLFHPPDFHFHSIDRVAFSLLICVVAARTCVLQEPIQFSSPVTWPMLGLLTIAFCGSWAQRYEAETWSLFAAKWLVPFMLFQLAKHVFRDAASARKLELFSLAVLGYLSLISIAFLVGASSLVFPGYILDPGLGIHADRARGPFLQAVANGVALNLLALVAVESFRRRRLPWPVSVALFGEVPVAILATKTRSVWLSFAGSVVMLALVSPSKRVRRLCLGAVAAACLALGVCLAFVDRDCGLWQRLEERSPVEFRAAVYQAGWDMFLAKPFAGWGATAMQQGLTRRVRAFRQENYYFHNTYLEIVVQYGLLGLALYVWVVVDLFRLGRRSGFRPNPSGSFLDSQFRAVWPVFLAVYFLNGCFVVMNYQFVNGFLFSLAGALSAQNRYSLGVRRLAGTS